MNGSERTVQLLGLTVARSQRARFLEEWHGDLIAARIVGLSPWAIVVAAARVALFLVWVRLRNSLLRRSSRLELVAVGCVLGFVVVAADVDLEYVTPLVALVLGWRLWGTLQAWIHGQR